MTGLVISSLAFFAVHMVPATRLRLRLVRTFGEAGYLCGFSATSLILLALMVLAYGVSAPAAALWTPNALTRVILATAMIIPTILAIAGVTSGNPAAVAGANILAEDATPHGIFTLTRHPLMLGIALWAGLHLIANPDLPSLVLFGTLAAIALYGIPLQDRRKQTEIGAAWRRYVAQTSVMPFGAILQGRVRLDLAGIGWRRIAAALVIWAGMLFAHQPIFGMPALVF